MHIDWRKNDTRSKWHYPAFGRLWDQELDIVVQLLLWMRATELVVHADCAKRARPAARCEVCPQLFPLTRCAQGGKTRCAQGGVTAYVGFGRGRGGGDCGFVIHRPAAARARSWRRLRRGDAAWQRWHLAIRHFGLFGGPVAAAND